MKANYNKRRRKRINPNAIKVIFCDNCKHEFSLKSVDIKEAIVEISRQALTLVYFMCPKCNKIYRVTLKDKRYEELVRDLELTKARIRKNHGSQNEEFARTLDSMMIKKSERIENHLMNLNSKFKGTFTFVASENNHKDKIITYLP